MTIFEICGVSKRSKAIELISATTPQRCWELLNRKRYTEISIERFVLKGGFPPVCFE